MVWVVLTHYSTSLKDAKLLEKWCNMAVVQFSNRAHGSDRPKRTTLRCTHDVYNHMALQCPGNHKPNLIRSLHRPTFGSSILQVKANINGLCVFRMCRALQQHFKAEFKFEATHRPPVGHFQSKLHKALISEYCTITNAKPSGDNYKVLPPILQGDWIGEMSSETGAAHQNGKYDIFHAPEQFQEKALILQHPFDSICCSRRYNPQKPF